jgi:DNA-binding transcriptional regulator YdaS (Cro superfamily)
MIENATGISRYDLRPDVFGKSPFKRRRKAA